MWEGQGCADVAMIDYKIEDIFKNMLCFDWFLGTISFSVAVQVHSMAVAISDRNVKLLLQQQQFETPTAHQKIYKMP